MAQTSPHPPTFADDRFVIHRTLGQGGMGVVYEAFDRRRGLLVAIKTMKAADATRLLRFKQEFRALAGVRHANLVALYELLSSGDQWYFTMELVDGQDFLAYVRSGAAAPAVWTDFTEATAVDGQGFGEAQRAQPVRSSAARPRASIERLRSASRQLISGILALHDAGKLHRDIKPNNIMVTARDRVVLLDFGLVTELRPSVGPADFAWGGTVSYMSPEQAGNAVLGPASDWYAVGAMLYEALTGAPPFQGTVDDVLRQKLECDALPPSRLDPSLPEDLSQLCVDLLSRDPARRPDGREILRRLSGTEAAGSSATPRAPRAAPSLVGRQAERAALETALARTERDHSPVVVSLRGPSGVGRTALLNAALAKLQSDAHALVLPGRCYERESLPYKAADGVIDALSRLLHQLPEPEQIELVPPGAACLARTFPVLLRVNGFAAADPGSLFGADQAEIRRRAVEALRELVRRLAVDWPVVIAVDDMQWGDVDSVALFEALVSPPDPPSVLLILAYRSEDEPGSAALRALSAWRARAEPSLFADVELGPLGAGESRALALSLLEGGAGAVRLSAAETIAREASGSPLFIHELCRFANEASGSLAVAQRDGRLSLPAALGARIAKLAPARRSVLQTVSLAGHPVLVPTAGSAAGISPGEALDAASDLTSQTLLRAAGSEDEVEVYNDRIRAAALEGIAEEQARVGHARLAAALEASGQAEPEALMSHWRAAGDLARAAGYAEQAAARADAQLAFDRAAELYRFALESGQHTPEGMLSLEHRLGDALANAGRGPEAAEVFARAAGRSRGLEALELRRKAAEQWLRAGHVDRGLEAIRGVLAALDLKLAETPTRALAALLARRAQVRLRGLNFRERAESDVPREQLARVDACWSVASGLAMVDTIRGADFNARTLLLSLEAGEPTRVVRSLSTEVSHTATGGGSAAKRVDALLEVTSGLARRIGSPLATGFADFAEGTARFLLGRYVPARAALDRSAQTFREQCSGVAWEAVSAELFGNMARFYLGEWGEIAHRVPAQLRDARARGDLYAMTNLRVGHSSAAWLHADRPDAALVQVDDAMLHWSSSGFHLEHFFELMARVHVDLYRGEGISAWERVKGAWAALSDTMLLRIQHLLLSALILRASSALAAAANSNAPGPFLAAARQDARAMEKESMGWTDPIAALFRAGVAAQEGNVSGARTLLETAVTGFEAQSMGMYAASARRRLGEIEGGTRGAEQVAAADGWMRARGVVRPERAAEVLAPGFARRQA